ncbi:hypothetical protein SMICM17S_06069 [Streptomyces microflavus]
MENRQGVLRPIAPCKGLDGSRGLRSPAVLSRVCVAADGPAVVPSADTPRSMVTGSASRAFVVCQAPP